MIRILDISLTITTYIAGGLLTRFFLQAGTTLPIEFQALASLGVGGVLSGIVLVWKRQDDKAYQKTLEAMVVRRDADQDRFIKVMENLTATMQALKETVAGQSPMQKVLDRLDDFDLRPRERNK